MRRINILMIAAIAVLAQLIALPAAAHEWNYDATLYGWFTGLDGTVGLGRLNDQPFEASFSDLANYLDFAAAGHFDCRTKTFRKQSQLGRRVYRWPLPHGFRKKMAFYPARRCRSWRVSTRLVWQRDVGLPS
ncbi:MAG: hypothetical protein ACREOO_16460 [bacterium]